MSICCILLLFKFSVLRLCKWLLSNVSILLLLMSRIVRRESVTLSKLVMLLKYNHTYLMAG